MSFKAFRRTILAGTLVAGLAATALPQIPVPVPVPPPLPGLEVRITTGRPPAVRYERRPVRPDPDCVWVNGFWDWDGERWIWVPGRWERVSVADVYWIPPRYVRSDRVYIYEPGHWSNQTVVVRDEIRVRHEWRRHEREHERELEKERDRKHHRDRDEDHDRDRR